MCCCMTAALRGFPETFPVRDDGRRPWRYRIVSATTNVALALWFGRSLRIEGVDRIPEHGPLLMVCNHLSNVDPFFFGARVPGTMFCMAKREIFAWNPLIAWLLGGCNCFPVQRGAPDRAALRTSIALLAHGGRLLIFVEGTRARKPGMQAVETGVAFLARRSGAQVQPVAVWGSENALGKGRALPRRATVHLRFGEPFTPELPAGRHDDAALAEQIALRIAALLPPPYRGVYGARLVKAG